MLTDPRQLPEAYATAVYARDVAAFVALYDPAIRSFDTWDSGEQVGLEKLESSTAAWFASLGDERVRVSVQDMTASVGESLSVLHGLITFQAVDVAGQPLRAGQERVTWVLEKRDEEWKVMHQHTSLAADFGTGKTVND